MEQRCDAGVLAGVAGLEGGAVDGQGFAVAAFGAVLEGQVGPGAGLCVSVLREDSGLEGCGVVESGGCVVAGVVGGPAAWMSAGR